MLWSSGFYVNKILMLSENRTCQILNYQQNSDAICSLKFDMYGFQIASKFFWSFKNLSGQL